MVFAGLQQWGQPLLLLGFYICITVRQSAAYVKVLHRSTL